MQALSRIGVTLIFAFLEVGCSFGFNILVERVDTGRPQFTLEKDALGGGRVDSINLNSFFVAERKDGKWDYENPLWAFELRPGSGLFVHKINYGEVPDGFMETAKAKPLMNGVQYIAIGTGPGSSGSTEFGIDR